MSSEMFKNVANVKSSLAEVMRQLRKKPPEASVVEEDKRDDEVPPSANDKDKKTIAEKQKADAIMEKADAGSNTNATASTKAKAKY